MPSQIVWWRNSGKSGGRFFSNASLAGGGLLDDFLQSLLCKSGGYSRSFGGLDEMPAANSVDHIMPIGSSKHREAHLFLVNLPCGQTRLCREDIVERSQAEAAERTQKDAKVFGVAVRGTDQTKDNLCLEKPLLILGGSVSGLQQAENIGDAWTSIVLIFSRRRSRQCLAAILLWQTQQAVVVRPSSVEAFDDEGFGFSKSGNFRMVDRQAECGEQTQAVELVFDAV